MGLVERNIRYPKEKIWSLQFTLPFTKIPKFMLIYMAFAATKVMNMFPRKGGNAYYSPGMIMTGMGVLIEELRIALGLYVQSTSSTMPQNSLEPWTSGAIALGSMGNAASGQVLLAFDTRKLPRWSHVKVVTMTTEFTA